mmetsp:Transcript_1257/g.1622  ORF Transcript_1257/g.1622 Transcript_1257/m.1622 type:complete len:209 (-) Transcript_1257:592-1218(-)
MPCVTRATLRKAMLRARLRSWRAAPPLRSGARRCHWGTLKSLLHRIIFRVNISRMYMMEEMSSAVRVAMAAPETPIDIVKIRKGSKMALNMLADMEIFRGVTVSSIPRKAEYPIFETSAGKNAKARIMRYGRANSNAGAPSVKTVRNTTSGFSNKNAVPNTANDTPTKNAWHTASCTPSWSLLAYSFDTSVAVTLGKYEMSQNAELNT